MLNYMNFVFCKTLLNLYNFHLNSVNKDVNLIEMLQWTVLEQFKDDLISGIFEDN